jgi:predicted HAD superfamily Cof-like phosphohydrolase
MSKVFNDVAVFMNAVGQSTDVDNKQQAKLYKTLIDEEYDEFLEGIATDDDAEQLDACFDMIWVIVGYMKSRGWDCNAAWEEGAKSNLSKIDSVTGLVRRREDGKILKPEGWQPPNFKQFLK